MSNETPTTEMNTTFDTNTDANQTTTPTDTNTDANQNTTPTDTNTDANQNTTMTIPPSYATTTTNNDFHASTVIRVARFEHYPQDTPNSYAVGFTITIPSNGKSIYRDTSIPYTETVNKNDGAIIAMAWDRLKEKVIEWYESAKQTSGVVGTIFNPISPQ